MTARIDISKEYIDALVQDCSISIANALEILQSCTKSSIFLQGKHQKVLVISP